MHEDDGGAALLIVGRFVKVSRKFRAVARGDFDDGGIQPRILVNSGEGEVVIFAAAPWLIGLNIKFGRLVGVGIDVRDIFLIGREVAACLPGCLVMRVRAPATGMGHRWRS